MNDRQTARSSESGFRALSYPLAQRQSVDWNELMSRRHTIHGLVEMDVTQARVSLHRYRRRTDGPASFTAFLVTSYAHAIAEEPSVQAYRKGSGKLVVFDDVDVAVLVEHEMQGGHVPVPHIVRNANRKTVREVDREIAAARAEAQPYARAYRLVPLWLHLPAFLRRFAISRVLASPHRRRRITGTATVTAVSMFGRGVGWGVPFISHSICLTVGGISRRPGYGPDGRLGPREVICLTISVDHDVVNGAPLARFISRFRELVEGAKLLVE